MGDNSNLEMLLEDLDLNNDHDYEGSFEDEDQNENENSGEMYDSGTLERAPPLSGVRLE